MKYPIPSKSAQSALLVSLALLAAAASAAAQTEEPAADGIVQLENYQVERTRQLSIPTRGIARAIVLQPEIVELTATSEGEAVFTGLRIGYSLVHLFDSAGRRTIRIEVTELKSILEEIARVKQGHLRDRLGLTKRALKLRYRGSHHNLERSNPEHGEIGNLDKLNETSRVRSHDIAARMPTAWGKLEGDLFLEQRRDLDIGKEVTQPRNMALRLMKSPVDFLGETDFVLGDEDLRLSEFTIKGRRYRGFGVFPSEDRPEDQRLGFTSFVGEEREGFFLDLPAGTQTRGDRAKLAGTKVSYELFDDFTPHFTSVHRFGDVEENRADNVFETGFDWDYADVSELQLAAARNGTEGAYELFSEITPWDGLLLSNDFWRVGKRYKTVTGFVSRDGQTGWSGSAKLVPPEFGGNFLFNTGAILYRDRNALNPANPRELNSAYYTGATQQLPWKLQLRGNATYEDQSGSPLPFVSRRYEVALSQELLVKDQPWMQGFLWGNRWLRGVNPFVSFRRAEYDKSNNVPGFDSTLKLARFGTRATFWGGLWAGITYSKAWLKESNPQVFPDQTRPTELTLEGGKSHRFKRFPLLLDFNIRYDDVENTFRKTHQPFSDRDRVSGSFRVSYRLGKESEIFGTLTATRQTTETTLTSPVLDLFAQVGVRLEWDTGWALGQTSRITGSVYQDLNFNGKRDPNEPGVPGVRVSVLEGPSAETDASGRFVLRSVKEGPQTLRADSNTIPKGFFFLTPSTVEKLIPGGQVIPADFGIGTEVQFRGRVFNDVDGDLKFTEGTDLPVGRVRVMLETGQSGASGSDGFYSIRRATSGPHTVSLQVETVPDGYQTLTPIRKEVGSEIGDVIEYNVPLKALRSVSGSVFVDANRNRARDAGEQGLGGIRVRMADREIFTDADGRYRLEDVPPGQWLLVLDAGSLPPEYRLYAEPVQLRVPAGPYMREQLNVPVVDVEASAGPEAKNGRE